MSSEDRIVSVNNHHRMAKEVLKEENDYPPVSSLKTCPICNSHDVIISYEKGQGFVEITENLVVSRASIYCEKCRKIRYEKVSLFDIKKDLVKKS